MTPLALAGYAALAYGGYWLYTNKIADKLGLPGGKGEAQLPPRPAGSPVSSLEKGRTYTVLAVITKDITDDQRWNMMSGTKNEEKIAQIIASTFAQSGFQVLNKPLIKDGAEMQKAIAGEPSTWVFNGRWLMDGDHVTNVIPWLAGASFYLVPTM